MKWNVWIPVACLGVIGMGCASATVNVRTEANEEVDRSGFTTYQWNQKTKAPEGHPNLSPEALDQAIRTEVDAGLQELGLRKVQSGADVEVGYAGAIEGDLKIDQINQQYGYAPGMGDRMPSQPGYRKYTGHWEPSAESIRFVEEGSLVLDIVETASGRMVWRAAADAEINKDLSKGQRTARFRSVVKRMLDGFK